MCLILSREWNGIKHNRLDRAYFNREREIKGSLPNLTLHNKKCKTKNSPNLPPPPVIITFVSDSPVQSSPVRSKKDNKTPQVKKPPPPKKNQNPVNPLLLHITLYSIYIYIVVPSTPGAISSSSSSSIYNVWDKFLFLSGAGAAPRPIWVGVADAEGCIGINRDTVY